MKNKLSKFFTFFIILLFSIQLMAVDVGDYTKYSYKKNKVAFEVKLDRFQYDYNQATFEDEDPDEDVFRQRRFRLATKLTIDNWSVKWAPDARIFDEGTDIIEETNDLYLRYSAKNYQITFGKSKVPFGMEFLTSSKDIRLLERSAITEEYFVGRQNGLNFDYFGNNFTAQLTVFEDKDSDDKYTNNPAARFTWAAINDDTSVLHFGLAFTERTQSYQGFEVAYLRPGFHLQSEYMQDETNSGSYISLGWVLGKETLKYSKGNLKAFKPKGNKGVWEFVYRLESGYGKYSDIELSTTDATSHGIGANYYLDKYWRFSINYTQGVNEDDEQGQEFRLRFQFIR